MMHGQKNIKIEILYSRYVFVDLDTQAPDCHLWLSRLYTIFPHFPVEGTIFEINIQNEITVLLFSTELSETLRGIESDTIKNVCGYFLKHPLYLTDSGETWIFAAEFREIIKYKISWKSFKLEPQN
jgi:hypothetical protein